jgi:hypothetical protein
MIRRSKMLNWEDQLDAWEEKYQPIKNHFTQKQEGEFVEDKFETYGEELDYVLSIANSEPDRVWTLVEGDDGNLYISSGYHLVNRLNYFITKNPCESEYEEAPYYIFEEEEEDA